MWGGADRIGCPAHPRRLCHGSRTMKLIGSTTSPYVRKVRIVLAEKKLDYQFLQDNVWGDDTTVSASPWIRRIGVFTLSAKENGDMLK